MRNLGLDLLRFIAVTLVLGRHILLPHNPNVILDSWYRGGWVGVDLFFVLSGFLVSSLLFQEHIRSGKIQIRRFLIRRAFKIYPAFWVLLIITIIIKIISKQPITIKAFFGELLFLQNYLGGLWNHTWSLAIEEHFYLGIAFLFTFVALQEKKFTQIPKIFVLLTATCFVFRLLNLLLFPHYSHRAYLYGTHIRVDSLFFGVLLSYYVYYKSLLSKIRYIPSIVLIVCGLVLLAPAFLFPLELHKWVSIVGVIFFYLGSGFLLIAFLRLETSKLYILQYFGILGASSYSIYLWHMLVNTWAKTLVLEITDSNPFPYYMIVYIIGSLSIGYLMSKFIEWPVLHFRDQLFPSKSNSPNPEQSATSYTHSANALSG